MKITEILKQEKPSLSFEVFPPNSGDSFDGVRAVTEEIAALCPSFMSVTYGAGGGASQYTLAIAENLARHGVTALAHLTCVTSTRADIRSRLTELREAGIENILALRGDVPAGEECALREYRHASDLIGDIRSFGDFCIGGACYPESHPDSPNCFTDIENLRKKAEAGCDFLTSQMFFDNNIYYNFLYRLREKEIEIPVIAGIMPVTSSKSIKRICAISGTALPQRFVRIVDRFGDSSAAMRQAGIAYATEQIVDLLANGVKAIHVYSMNKPDIAKAILDNLSEILR